MKRPNDPEASQSPTPPTPEPPDAIDRVDLGTMVGLIYDAQYRFFRTQSLLKVCSQYLHLQQASSNDGLGLDPANLGFVMEDGLEHLENMKELLDHLEGATTLVSRGEPVDLAADVRPSQRQWARLRRYWFASEPEERALIMRCVRLVQGHRWVHQDIHRVFTQLEAKQGVSSEPQPSEDEGR